VNRLSQYLSPRSAATSWRRRDRRLAQGVQLMDLRLGQLAPQSRCDDGLAFWRHDVRASGPCKHPCLGHPTLSARTGPRLQLTRHAFPGHGAAKVSTIHCRRVKCYACTSCGLKPECNPNWAAGAKSADKPNSLPEAFFSLLRAQAVLQTWLADVASRKSSARLTADAEPRKFS